MLTYADLLTYADMLTRRSASIWCPARSPTSFLFIFLFVFLFFPYFFGHRESELLLSTVHRCTTRSPTSPLFRYFYLLLFLFIYFAQVHHALADLSSFS
jgi:hypothetical protein